MSGKRIEALLDRSYFETLVTGAMKSLRPGEHLAAMLRGEGTQFVRINAARVRQIGTVEDAQLELTMVHESKEAGRFVLRKCSRAISLTGLSYEDQDRVKSAVEALRQEVVQLPPDTFAQLPPSGKGSESESAGEIPAIDQAVGRILEPCANLDIAGIYAAGPVIRAMANSSGLRHWFKTETFDFDYSLYTPSERAVKGSYAGNRWESARFGQKIASDAERLRALEAPARKVARGDYRVYLAPSAVDDLVSMFNWRTIGEAAIRQGESALRLMRQGEKSLSPKFSLSEDFRSGRVNRFNDEGELAPEVLALIEQGKLVHSLVSSRSAKEYGVTSNFAVDSESMRAPAVAPGALAPNDILRRLDTGLYLSNLHYLNWSDQPAGRITGMTRYACFWVENGKLVSPIENMRWDDSLFSLFGGALEELGAEAEVLPHIGTYYFRQLGGSKVPGALLSKMSFTL